VGTVVACVVVVVVAFTVVVGKHCVGTNASHWLVHPSQLFAFPSSQSSPSVACRMPSPQYS
jgi:hypothetical protein